MNKTYFCYTDGSCKKVPDAPGGWGVHVKGPNGEITERSGGEIKTTISAMELTAIREALTLLPSGAEAKIFCDSNSAIDTCTKQLADWQRNGWKNCAADILPLAQKISELISSKSLKVEWEWIRGHHGNRGNERADFLAGEGARKAKKELVDKKRGDR